MSLCRADTDLTRFVDVVDRCESMWCKGEHEQLYNYVSDLERRLPDLLPVKILAAWREEQFGCQFEKEASELRRITNQLNCVICEINPELMARLGEMANDADEMGKACTKAKQDKEFRRNEYDPRANGGKKSFGPYLQKCFMDVPFLVPDFDASSGGHAPKAIQRSSKTSHGKALNYRELGSKVFDKNVSFVQKKALLDDYVHEIAVASGVKGLVDKFDDDAVRLNGYCALSILREREKESKQVLKDYVERQNLSIGADYAKRMAVWALLQFAHDDPEVASYLRTLPSKVGDRSPRTLEYLKLAIKHLDEGCPRHFVSAPTSPQKIENGAGGN